MKLSDFDFDLPVELIAQHPAPQRSASRMLVVNHGSKGSIQDRQFFDLLDLVNPGDVLVFNNSKVIPARLFGEKATGGRVEILVERVLASNQASCLMRVSKKPGANAEIRLAEDHRLRVLGRDPQHPDRFHLEFSAPVLTVLDRIGEVPLPPYITHSADAQDTERYQTVYAQHPGSIAAPTAGLHFDDAMLKALDNKGVQRAFLTLHVGSGTFAPVKSEHLDDHRMHSEWYEISPQTAESVNLAKREGRRVIAVGTTSLRTLEAAGPRGVLNPGSGETDLFIKPGDHFKMVDALLTNFHLPRSTLLMLVAALIGYDTMRSAYAHAIEQRYRFFSYGDAMFCLKNEI